MFIPKNTKQYWKERIILAWIALVLQILTISLILWMN